MDIKKEVNKFLHANFEISLDDISKSVDELKNELFGLDKSENKTDIDWDKELRLFIEFVIKNKAVVISNPITTFEALQKVYNRELTCEQIKCKYFS